MDDNELYSIGDTARRTGLSVSAIRFYSDIGIIPPTELTNGGFRLYDIHAVARLSLVRTLREMDANLDEVRRLLAEETTLRELATTHLGLVERQTRRLQARRAVLRTIVKQHSSTEQVSLMHKLVSMSDDERDRLIDEFWDEITDGINVHPAFAEQMHQWRCKLPEEPTTEQLEAWIELADLVRDAEYRRSVRQFFETSFSASERSIEITAPPMLAAIEKQHKVDLEAAEAQQRGVAVDSPMAREIVERLVVATAEITAEASGRAADEADIEEVRGWLADPPELNNVGDAVDGFMTQWGGIFDRFIALTATINGTPGPDPAGTAATEAWVAAVIKAAEDPK
ncbi:helix-turn-helix domain-containing protein [Actinoalloteichus hymeniacidonis]|uniref:helix-turn-helix domain-containing protein n=1 Tax=Actinoalloteichus hymeniacidonis TaxID=340345 RepID=UPI00085301C2|nr:MerR family transcriptional regulator [Actinoalloteichus hymeniacidonis]MBB5905750.1 DNA-binding transcriptional MerR regulator [Actinoalloteichus hymeniacidonis]